MSRRPRLARLSVAVLLVAAAAISPRAQEAAPQSEPKRSSAARRQCLNFVYRVPDGWLVAETSAQALGTVRLRQSDASARLAIDLHSGASMPRDAAKWLEQRMTAVLAQGETTSDQRSPRPVQVGTRRVLVASQKIGETLRLHAAIPSAQRIEHVSFEAPINGDAKGQARVWFWPFLADLQFIDEGARPSIRAAAPETAPPPNPELGDHQLEGAYYGQHTRRRNDRTKVEHRLYLFTRDGRFYRSSPRGRSPLDVEGAVSATPSRGGDYSIHDNRVVFAYADGSSRGLRWKRAEDGSVWIGVVRYRRIEAPADDQRLSGDFRRQAYRSIANPSGLNGGAGGVHRLVLRADGTFEATDLVFAAGRIPGAKGRPTDSYTTERREPVQRGSYTIRNGVLTLTGDGGKVARRSMLVIKPGILLLDGLPYYRG